MSDLAKLVADLSSLTELEADELAAMLDAEWGARAARAVMILRALPDNAWARKAAGEDLGDLAAEDWLTAESLSLASEAGARVRSLDDTLDYVRSRCDAIRTAA